MLLGSYKTGSLLNSSIYGNVHRHRIQLGVQEILSDLKYNLFYVLIISPNSELESNNV